MSSQQHGPVQPSLSSPFSNEQIVNWLIDECRDAGSRISAFPTSGDRILTAGSTVVAVVATVAISGGNSHLLMWLPLGVSLAIVYALYVNGATRTLIGYKIGLEKEIERRTGIPLIAWHSRIGVHTGAINRHVFGMLSMALVAYLGSVGLAMVQATQTLSSGAWGHERAWFYITVTAVSIIVSTSVIGFCLWIQRHSATAAEQKVADMFRPHSPAPHTA